MNTGVTNAVGALQPGYDAARTSLTGGYNDATNYANTGATGAINYIDKGVAGATDWLNQGRADYDPLSALATKYGGATTLGLNALGVNGADAMGTARDAFTASPAYNFNYDQGLEAINRRRNAGGMLDSGNADRDAQTFGAGLASNEYNTWLQNLLGFVNPEMSATGAAASGRAGLAQAGAGIESQAGAQRAGIEGNRSAMLADLASRYGINMAGLDTGQANTLAGLYSGQGNTLAGLETGAAGQKVGLATNIAQPYAQTYGNEATAQMQGSKNLWDFGLNAAKTIAGIPSIGGAGSMTMQPNPNGGGLSPMASNGFSLQRLLGW